MFLVYRKSQVHKHFPSFFHPNLRYVVMGFALGMLPWELFVYNDVIYSKIEIFVATDNNLLDRGQQLSAISKCNHQQTVFSSTLSLPLGGPATTMCWPMSPWPNWKLSSNRSLRIRRRLRSGPSRSTSRFRPRLSKR